MKSWLLPVKRLEGSLERAAAADIQRMGAPATRLETRTMDLHSAASRRVQARRRSDSNRLHTERVPVERRCVDPKDNDLCLARTKPAERLVEVRRCVDVQITLHSWA